MLTMCHSIFSKIESRIFGRADMRTACVILKLGWGLAETALIMRDEKLLQFLAFRNSY